MKNKEFQVEINVLETEPDFTNGGDVPEFKGVKTKKILTFKHLNQQDRDQHDLHFLILAHYTAGATKKKNKNTLTVDYRFSLDITTRFMEDMIVLTEGFNLTDKELVLSDSGALMQLANVLIADHVIPFFLKLMESMT